MIYAYIWKNLARTCKHRVDNGTPEKNRGVGNLALTQREQRAHAACFGANATTHLRRGTTRNRNSTACASDVDFFPNALATTGSARLGTTSPSRPFRRIVRGREPLGARPPTARLAAAGGRRRRERTSRKRRCLPRYN